MNVDLMQKTMDYIEAHPEEWDQDEWRCETTMCFAGWAVALSGNYFFNDSIDATRKKNGRNIGIDSAAREELGLTFSQSSSLFLHSTNVKDVEEFKRDYFEPIMRQAGQG